MSKSDWVQMKENKSPACTFYKLYLRYNTSVGLRYILYSYNIIEKPITRWIKAYVHFVDLSLVRLFWQVLNRLLDERDLTVSAGRSAKYPCPLKSSSRKTA